MALSDDLNTTKKENVKYFAYCFFAFSSLLTGCAELAEGSDPGQGYEEKVQITGSNIPRRKSSSDVSVASKEDTERAMRTMNNPAPLSPPSSR